MDFQKDVIEASFHQPVVVDFWAPWCGPCKMLGPIIEQLAREQSERWSLVKLNTEEEQELAMQYGIRSIPNVKMFHKGEVVAEFMGALPRQQILSWLEEHLPDERRAEVEEALSLLQQDRQAGLDRLREIVQGAPDLEEARVALARELVFADPGQAAEYVSDIRLGDKHSDTAEDIRLIGVFMEHRPDHSPAGLALNKAQQALKKGDLEGGILRVIEATQADKKYSNELPRKVAIALFRLLGTDHPLTSEYRWRFDMALY